MLILPPLTLPDLWSFLLIALAVYRVSSMLVEEDGPFHVFLLWRKFMWAKAPQWVGQGFSCFYCLSFWVSLVAADILSPRLDVGLVVVWLSLAGLVQMVRRYEDHRASLLSATRRMASK